MIVCKGSPRFTTINLRSEDAVIKLYCRPYWLCKISSAMSFYFLSLTPTSPPRVALVTNSNSNFVIILELI